MSPLKVVTIVLALVAAGSARPDHGAAPPAPQPPYGAPPPPPPPPPTYAPPPPPTYAPPPPSTYSPPPPPTYAPPPPPSYTPPPPTYGNPEPEPAKPEYSFDWAVKDDYSGNDFGHQETRDGYDTQGSYYVLLPDGRIERVTYTVNGESGFVATVEFEGEAKEVEPYGHTPPAYAPPPPPPYGHA